MLALSEAEAVELLVLLELLVVVVAVFDTGAGLLLSYVFEAASVSAAAGAGRMAGQRKVAISPMLRAFLSEPII